MEDSLWESDQKQDLMIPTWSVKLVKKQYPSLDLHIAPIDTRLIIPKLWTNVPILSMPTQTLAVNEWSEFEDKVQWELKNWVVHYPWTALPWWIWNTFITWHSSYYPWDDWRYKDVFAKLHKLDIWDSYYIYSWQKKYKYHITEKKVVTPSNVSVLEQPQDKKISTLMTCTPLGTNLRRLILVSELI